MSRRLLGEHFRADGKPKKAYANRCAALYLAPLNATAYRCSWCGHWHRATLRGSRR